MSWLPGLKGFVGSTTHLPSGPTVVEPIGVLPSYMVMVSPGVPVPLIDGLVSPVAPPEGIGMPLSSVMPLMTGLDGVWVSMVMAQMAEAALAPSWPGRNWVTVMLCRPSDNAPAIFVDQWPVASTMAPPQPMPF